MSEFDVFGRAVRARFKEMSNEQLFVVGTDRDLIWEKYLKAFPAGSDPMFRKRTEHDCSCCRHFIRDIGNVVAIQNGALSTIWDLNGLPDHYQAVADAMSEYVKSCAIRDVYLTKQGGMHGTPVNREKGMEAGDHVVTWTHFAAEVPSKFVHSDVATKQGELRTTYDVLKRGVFELDPEAVENVLDLIKSNTLYRGEEHKKAVEEFQKLQLRARSLPGAARDILLWGMLSSPAARFRNTVIGTLVQDLSEGRDLETAVKAFETKVAPLNYKRPKTLITKKMVDDAMATVQELGLEEALQRRHARLTDVSINSVLFVDNSVKGKLKGGLTDLLMEEVKPAKFDAAKAKEITVHEFVSTVLPNVTGLQLYLASNLLRNFVSLTAPAHPEPKSLFKWDNDFAWSYEGNVTDTIKDKVKRAGGQVENVLLRASLAWNNTDDLDLHMREPGGFHIYHGSKRSASGYLDVDMNVSGETREPVENIRYARQLPIGEYRLVVHQFRKRESIDVGFTVEIEAGGQLSSFQYPRTVASNAQVLVAMIQVGKGGAVTIAPGPGVIHGALSQEQWGLKTLDLVKVNSVVLSPNYWDGNAVGNKHYFFILDGCKNPEPTRGIYNEFLSNKLDKHRKVFEVLGDKTKCPVADEQLSGVGFSSTNKDKVTVVAMGPKLNKPYTIVF